MLRIPYRCRDSFKALIEFALVKLSEDKTRTELSDVEKETMEALGNNSWWDNKYDSI